MFSFKDIQDFLVKQQNIPDDIRFDRALSIGPNQEQDNGFINMNGDYSGAETYFKLQPKYIDVTYYVFRMLLSIRTSGKFNSGSYGNSITLTNGIKVRVCSDSLPNPDTALLTFVPIIRTADWQIYCYDFMLSDFGIGDNYGSARWTFAKGGFPLVLKGNDNQCLEAVLHDDFTDLEHHYLYTQGIKLNRDFTEV